MLNLDSLRAKNYELTDDGLKIWIPVGVADKLLDYGTHKEVIKKDNLTDPKSVNTLVGSPICLNHPPRAIASSNRDSYAIGTCLQQFDVVDNTLMMSGIIWNDKAIKVLSNQDSIYTSAGYTCDKHLNDGIYFQTNRKYNHVAALTPEYQPRAGKDCQILMINEQQDSTPDLSKEVSDRVAILSKYGDVLTDNNFAIDYSENTDSLKRKVLKSVYNTDGGVIDNLSEQELNGFWINFELAKMNKDSRSPLKPKSDPRAEFVDRLTNKKA